MRRTIIIFASETTVIYDTTLSFREIREWLEKCCDESPEDMFAVKQEELQYYSIDGRIWMDEEKDEKIREFIKCA